MTDKFVIAILRLVPAGQAWRGVASVFKAFIEALGFQFERLYSFLSEIVAESLPENATHLLPEWYQTLGLKYNGTLLLDDLRAKAKAFDTAVGGQTIEYLQGQIDAAAIDVTLYETVLSEAAKIGSPSARCGVSVCSGSFVDVAPGSSYLWYYLVRGTVDNSAELAQLVEILQKLAPAHMEPDFDLEFAYIKARCGAAVCGVTRVGNL